jgi:hypothetical protein
VDVVIHVEATLTQQDSRLLANFKAKRCLNISVGLAHAIATHDANLVADFHRFIAILERARIYFASIIKEN